MYNDCNSSLEKKRKLDKMNMVLNNIQHLLSEHVGLCKEVDRVIEMSCECKKVVAQLKLLKTNIPALEKRINTLLLDCISSCNEAKEILLLKIENYLLVKQKKDLKQKTIEKIKITINCCIEEYETYKLTSYHSMYGNGEESNVDISSMMLLL